MHIHKLEKIWLVFGVAILLAFLITMGVSAFYVGNKPPSCITTIDPKKVETTAPFNEPGLHKVEGKDWDYELVYIADKFQFMAGDEKIVIPVNSKVKIISTAVDVVHGFEIAKTATNMMLLPGYVSENIQTFDTPGEYLVVCNEYCGEPHAEMYTTIEVSE